jgi:hypothetical protein
MFGGRHVADYILPLQSSYVAELQRRKVATVPIASKLARLQSSIR